MKEYKALWNRQPPGFWAAFGRHLAGAVALVIIALAMTTAMAFAASVLGSAWAGVATVLVPLGVGACALAAHDETKAQDVTDAGSTCTGLLTKPEDVVGVRTAHPRERGRRNHA